MDKFNNPIKLGLVDVYLERVVAFVVAFGALFALHSAIGVLLLILTTVIAIHEGGHLVVARASKMLPTDYAIGMGPSLITFQSKSGTTYHVKALPIGGFVKIPGMNADSEIPEDFPESGTYRSATNRGKLATILAGPATNLITAFIVLTLSVSSLTVSAKFISFILTSTATALPSVVADIPTQLASIFGNAPVETEVLSVVEQVRITGAVQAGEGPMTVAQWFAFMSIAIGAFNLVPLPPLDGWHATVALLDAVTSRIGAKVNRITNHCASLIAEPLTYTILGVLVIAQVLAIIADVTTL